MQSHAIEVQVRIVLTSSSFKVKYDLSDLDLNAYSSFGINYFINTTHWTKYCLSSIQNSQSGCIFEVVQGLS
jgi:hypothetical protein